MVGATLAVALAAKRIGTVLSLMHHPLRPASRANPYIVGATLAVALLVVARGYPFSTFPIG